MKYKYILLDADDTLLDFEEAERASFMKTLAAFSPTVEYDCDELYSLYHRINDELWKALERGETTREKLKTERFARVFEQSGVLPESDAPEFAAAYMQALSRESALKPGAIETCAALSRKYRLCIVTNGTSFVQKGRLSPSPIMQYISDVFISEDIGANKPSPLFFDHVVSAVGDTDRSHYAVVGDSVSSDINGAVAAGMDSVLVTWGRGNISSGATYTVNKIEDILEIFLPEEHNA